jgi:cellulose synthase/poly-beta-1,6-N-acetylglucosamine synthase-like glycosyltransferase
VAGKPVRRASITPSVSFVIAARNEAPRIGEKLENALALDYPPGRLEIIVASDASDDGTDEIVRAYEPAGVKLVRSPERRGKEHAQALAIGVSQGEILVFSDVATRLEVEGVRRIVESFADPEVGCVSSVDRVLDATGEPTGEGAYVRYEMLLRSLESRVGSVVGLSGSFFAARRVLCEPWPLDLPSDFTTLLRTVDRGMRGVLDRESVGTYSDLGDASAEYSRKVRTVTRGLRGLARNLTVLNPFRTGVAAWQVFSHKLCRWLVPFALAGLLLANIPLATRSLFYASVLVLQLFAYAAAWLMLRRPTPPTGALRLLSFFVLVNMSILQAWLDVVRGRQAVTWAPSRR